MNEKKREKKGIRKRAQLRAYKKVQAPTIEELKSSAVRRIRAVDEARDSAAKSTMHFP